MSDGATHEKYAVKGLFCIGVATVAANLLYEFPPAVYFAIPGAVLSFLLDSDIMDQAQISTRGEHRLYKFFWLLGFIIEVYTFPLARILVHRSIYSHLPGLNTAVRIAYYIVPLVWLLWGWDGFVYLYTNYLNEIIWFYVGGVLIDAIHATLDKWRFVW